MFRAVRELSNPNFGNGCVFAGKLTRSMILTLILSRQKNDKANPFSYDQTISAFIKLIFQPKPPYLLTSLPKKLNCVQIFERTEANMFYGII